MAPGSPRVTRARAKARGKNDNDYDDNSRHDHDSTGSHNDSSGSEAEGEYSHTYSSLGSNSPNSSSDRSLYPDLSDLYESANLNESGNLNMSSHSDGNKRKGKSLTPDVTTHSRTSQNKKTSSKTRKESDVNEMTMDKPTDNSYSILLFVGLAIVFVAVVYVLFPGSSSTLGKVSKIPMSGFDRFEKDVKVLQSTFPSQTKRFWNTVSASARHVYYQQDPCYPSVILIASHDKNHRLNTCLAKKIAYTFSVSRGVESGALDVGMDIEDIKHLDPEQQKLELDDTLKLAFQKRGEKAFVISNVQLLAPKAALLLHGFCDGDNAPYKDVMILLSLQVEDDVDFKSVKEVEDYLVKVWSKGLDMDKLSAIMSRIANNPVVIRSEADSVVNSMCS